MKQPTRGAWLFVLVAVVSAAAALIPLFRGRSVNGTLLGVAGFWLVVAFIIASRARGSSGADRD